jgi:hypothetical protein
MVDDFLTKVGFRVPTTARELRRGTAAVGPQGGGLGLGPKGKGLVFRMRKGWRKLMAGMGMVLFGTIALAASPEPLPRGAGKLVRMTVEVTWTMPPARESPACDLELTEGKVVEALTWPGGERRALEQLPKGAWSLGTEPSGRVRARIEAPLTASLRVRAGGQVFQFPLLALLEGPQRSPAPSPVEVAVQRLPWDSLMVALSQGDGTAAPGATVPVSVGFNVLTPEPTEVMLRCSAELRPIREGEPVWRQSEIREVVATDVHDPPRFLWNVAVPQAEGTYVLEVRSAWEPVAASESTRLSRWLRRKRNPAPVTSAVRRVTLAVVDKGKDGAPSASEVAAPADTIDLSRLRSYRPTATGRAPVVGPGQAAWAVPEAALVEETRRDRLRGWILRTGPEAANLAPAEASGLAWSAIGMKVAHPGRPHRLSLTVLGGHPSALGVGLVETTDAGGRPRVVLDACASGPPVVAGGAPASFSWLVWPDASEPVLVLVNRDAAPVQLGTVALAELAEVPAGPPITEPGAEGARRLGLDLTGVHALDRFGGGEPGQEDTLTLGRNLGQYLVFCGASSVVLPERLADRSRRRALDGQAAEDATGPDRLDLLLRLLGSQGCSAWLELALGGRLPGLPDPGSDEALERGLVRVDRRGLADGPALTYHPLHPGVREALKRRVAEAAAIRMARPALTGLLIRLGPSPTLLSGPDTGFDDFTFGRFVRETFDPETARGVPGLGTTDPDRYAERSKFLAGSGRMPWLTWRSRGIAALYGELNETARRAGPGSVLVVATPVLDNGPAGNEARRVDLAGLAPSQAWRAVGLDLDAWPTGEQAPIVLRGASLSTDDLAHDLATSPELDAQVAARPGRGLLLGTDADAAPTLGAGDFRPMFAGDTGLRLSALPLSSGPEGDEPLEHALAALDARWIVLAATVAAGHEERVRRFAPIFRALPVAPVVEPPLDRQPFGVAVRPLRSGANTYLEMANDTPYPIRLDTVLGAPASALVDDLGRRLRLTPETIAGERHVVLDLPPFGVAAIRIGAPEVRVGPLVPYPSQAVMDRLLACSRELSSQLSRLDRAPAEDRAGPPNPGFEPAASRAVQLTVARGPAVPRGWTLVGGGANMAEIDLAQPYSGRGSLRLSAQAPPAVVISESFVPNAQATLDLQGWYRTDRPDTRLRVWIEGEAAGQPFLRQTDLAVSPDEWTALGVRIADVPAGGLSRARIRFELLTPGSVWIDDVSVSGESLTEPERINARRALLAALRAYHDKRYADFARLAGSHWARHPGVVGAGRASGEGAASDRAGMIRTGGGTALPPDRRLR